MWQLQVRSHFGNWENNLIKKWDIIVASPCVFVEFCRTKNVEKRQKMGDNKEKTLKEM